ncbi:unnamed protein product [Prorocentrum cordatum]|uniref:Uncharacterized protein n=1 Tax=Prorocentrum cordatum TaxID=2364126 RepID=A0ABN9QVH1_9DINO|nr:unnamed protein product [Polarella glacialis]
MVLAVTIFLLVVGVLVMTTLMVEEMTAVADLGDVGETIVRPLVIPGSTLDATRGRQLHGRAVAVHCTRLLDIIAVYSQRCRSSLSIRTRRFSFRILVSFLPKLIALSFMMETDFLFVTAMLLTLFFWSFVPAIVKEEVVTSLMPFFMRLVWLICLTIELRCLADRWSFLCLVTVYLLQIVWALLDLMLVSFPRDVRLFPKTVNIATTLLLRLVRVCS